MANQYKNEVIYSGQTLMSLKEDTVTPNTVLAGETFHDRSGAPQTGNLITHTVYDGLDSTSTSDALSANQGRALNSKFTINNVTLTPSGNTIGGSVKIQGKLVVGNISSTGKTCAPATYTTIATINKRPIDTMYFPVFSGANGSYVGMCRIQYDGVIDVYPSVNTSNVAMSFAYFTND